MKSERKQIQESNLLADKIEAYFVKLKAVLPAVLVLSVIALIALFGYGFYSSLQQKEAAKGWTALYFADTDASDLKSISADFGASVPGLWARQTAGDGFMASALEKIYENRDSADQFYKQAIEEYKFVADKASDPFLKARALYGLAQAYEGLADREQALTYYRKIPSSKDLSPEFLEEVNKRTTWLESKSADEFYTWFKETRAISDVPSTPTTPKDLPKAPDFGLPPLPTSEESSKATPPNIPTVPSTEDAGSTPPAVPELKTPEASETTPPAEPANDQPVESKP